MTTKKKIAFVDRDGTILIEPEDKQIDTLAKFSFKPGSIEFLRRLKILGYELILVTNQDGLGTIGYPSKTFEELNTLMLRILESEGISFSEIYICPHFESDGCRCRKPQLGLLPVYLQKGDFDREQSFVVGDRESDLIFAKNLSIKGFNCSELEWREIIKEVESLSCVSIDRVTNETAIKLKLIKKSGHNQISTTIPFFDHMLDAMLRFSGFSALIKATGDTQIDEHHLVEDVAICLGEAFKQSTTNKKGIQRFSQWTPMDESLSRIAIDVCNRTSFEFQGDFGRGSIGGLSNEMVVHFFKTFAFTMQLGVHMEFRGLNTHHQYESLFKGFGLTLKRALRVSLDGDVPSTKGQL